MINMFDKKKVLRSVSLGMSTVVLVGAGLLSGCTPAPSNNNADGNKDNTPPAAQEDKKDNIMPEFVALIGENPKPAVIIQFMSNYIASVSREDAAKMLVELERSQLGYLPTMEEKYYAATNIQESLSKIYNDGFDLDKIDETQDPALKGLLKETRDMGFKVETAEGTFFPIMNYENLKKFSPYANDEIRDYIDIMAVETNKVPAKDAALVIGWDDVVDRALAQEAYVKKYSSSAKAESIKELQKKYLTFMMLGLNNTPLFSYEDKTMDKEAKEAYLKAIKDNEGNKDSELIKLLGNYMKLVEKSGYKLTDEVDKFRKDAIGSN